MDFCSEVSLITKAAVRNLNLKIKRSQKISVQGVSNLSSQSLSTTTSLSVCIPQDKGKTLVKKISDLYIINELFSFENDMEDIKNDPKFAQFTPWAFNCSKPSVTTDMLLGNS